MSSIPSNSSKHRPPVPRDQEDALWDLLGKARREVTVSRDFATRTTKLVRDMPQDGPDERAARILAFPSWVRRSLAPVAAAAACVALLLVWQGREAGDGNGTIVADTTQPIEGTVQAGIPLYVEPWEWEVDELTWLDQVVSVNDPTNLSDDALDFLLF